MGEGERVLSGAAEALDCRVLSVTAALQRYRKLYEPGMNPNFTGTRVSVTGINKLGFYLVC